MAVTPLHDQLLAAGARLGEYQGAETAAAFADPRREFVELRSGCGIYDLGWRAKIVAGGKDRVRWANGMVSNNVRDLPANRGVYSFVLNAQGHILGDLYLYNRGEHLLLDTTREQAPKLLHLLRRYIIMDQVELTEVDDKLTALAVQGPRAREVLRDAGFHFADVEPLAVQDIVWNDIGLSVTRTTGEIAPTFEIWVAPAHAGAAWDALAARGAHPVGADALEMFRVAAGIPRYGQDISERLLPQETGQEQALNFTKGCYIGQEIVERIRSRGMVHRRLTGFVVQGTPPAPGAKIQSDGKEVGEITSTAVVPAGDGDHTLALGYVRVEAGQPGSEVQIGDTRATVSALPFKDL